MRWLSRAGTLTRVGKNAAALFMARLTVLILGLWLNGQLARALGAEGLGRYLLALTLEGITLALCNLGLNTLATRELSRAPAEEAEALLGTVVGVKAAAALVSLLVLNGVVAPWLFAGSRYGLIALASLAVVPQALNGGMEALIRARQRMEISSGIEVGARLIAVLGGLAALRLGGQEGRVLACYVGGHVLASMGLVAVLARWGVWPQWRGWWRRAWPLVREALPFAGADLVAMLYRRVDLMLLSLWHGDAAVGVYGAAYRLWETLGLFPASVLDALFPELARRGAEGKAKARLGRIYRRAAPALLGLVVLIGAPAYWLAPQIMGLIYGNMAQLAHAVGILRLLILALPFTYLYLLNGHLLYALGEQRRVLRAMALVTIGAVALNVALIPTFGYWAAVGVALSAEVALLLMLARAAHPFVRRAPNPRGDV
jgi:O-antigen/teichoic acid export membrane protein